MTNSAISSAAQPDQAAVYRRYVQLQSIRAERFPCDAALGLAGLLLTCVEFGREGAELALATTISGGTFLGIDPSGEHLKAAVRNGACDFMVNTLDESLRVLKNELRKKKALSVGLLGEASAILLAMAERGVQPDLVADCASSRGGSNRPYPAALMEFIERGAVRVDTHASTVAGLGGFVEVVWTAASLTDLRRMDELALGLISTDDSIRRRWLQQAPGYFHRQRPLQRVVGLRSEEVTQLAGEFTKAISAGEMQSPATFVWRAEDGSKETVALQ